MYGPLSTRRTVILLDNVYTVGLGEYSNTIYQRYDYKRYSFTFHIHYQTKNQLFLFLKVADEYIANEGN